MKNIIVIFAIKYSYTTQFLYNINLYCVSTLFKLFSPSAQNYLE